MAASDPDPEGTTPDFPWHVASRLGEIDGEARANVLRAAGIALFYGTELAAYHGVALGSLGLSYARSALEHEVISLLAGAWALLSLAVLALVRRRFVPPALKFLTTAGDLVLLTAILATSDGPKSPMIVGYLLVVVLAATRLSLPLVRAATVGAGVSFLVLLGVARARDAASPPRYHQLVFLLAIGFLGVMLGQLVRRARRVAEEYAERREGERLDADEEGMA